MRRWLGRFILSMILIACSATPARAAEDDGDLFGRALDLGIWTVIVCLVLLFVLRRTAWKWMLEGLEKREHDIAAAVEEAKKAKDEAAQLRASMQQEIAKGHDEVRELIARARADADRLKQQREAEGEAVVAAERERFEREKSMARDQALHDLWSQTAELAALVSSKAIRRQLTAEDHRALVDEALQELPQAAAHRHQGDGRAT